MKQWLTAQYGEEAAVGGWLGAAGGIGGVGGAGGVAGVGGGPPKKSPLPDRLGQQPKPPALEPRIELIA